jgi:ubiquinone/menaquinone biosynthesis C-methylase UbiE
MLPAREANRRCFLQAYQTGEHGWAVDKPSSYAAAFLRELKKIVPGGELLDIGCGEGRHAISAARLGFRVTAVDYEILALRRARKHAKIEGAEGISFRKADVLALPFRDRTFDVVLDYGCLHHQRKSDWPAYKSGVLRILKPRGFYVLSVFSPKFRFFRGSRRPWHIAHGAYRRCFTPDDIMGLFGDRFEVMEMIEEKGKDQGFRHLLMKRREEA